MFYQFGPDASSWLIGNERFSHAQNPQPRLQQAWADIGSMFQDKSMTGSQILWMTTGPNDAYCIATTDGQSS
ncbi:hypothetical protein BT63DRAFT_429388 [Microthyrium microscopicum]|uniref:Uncharacterized protein n=1 Tax=Microthyrium microscopicum TaxID=703497 RepID=A0A6A6TY45_9PEZI|nr:hypothetical protein BT63DRAFT_429388 [Microthyrium microscopicum]